jgi:hypothetical protein
VTFKAVFQSCVALLTLQQFGRQFTHSPGGAKAWRSRGYCAGLSDCLQCRHHGFRLHTLDHVTRVDVGFPAWCRLAGYSAVIPYQKSVCGKLGHHWRLLADCGRVTGDPEVDRENGWMGCQSSVRFFASAWFRNCTLLANNHEVNTLRVSS